MTRAPPEFQSRDITNFAQKTISTNSDHGGTFFQGNFFPAGVTAADDVVWSLVVYAGDFCNEDGGTRGE
jgi:hypothetical protein